jgi:pyruvate carboxylase
LAHSPPGAEALFGNKVRSRQLAGQCGVPVLAGSAGPTSLDEVKAFTWENPQRLRLSRRRTTKKYPFIDCW